MEQKTNQIALNQNYTPINPNFSYLEKEIYGKRTCTIIFAIIFLIIGIVIFLCEYYIAEGRQIGVYMGILGGLVFIDTYIILSGFGLKICINNVKKTITMRYIILIPCCCSTTYKYTEIDSIEYNCQTGVNFQSITLIIHTKDPARKKNYSVGISGSCTGSCNCLGVNLDVLPTINLANELIRQANQVNLPIYT